LSHAFAIHGSYMLNVFLRPHRLTRGISGGGVPPWATPNFHSRVYAPAKTSYAPGTLYAIQNIFLTENKE